MVEIVGDILLDENTINRVCLWEDIRDKEVD